MSVGSGPIEKNPSVSVVQEKNVSAVLRNGCVPRLCADVSFPTALPRAEKGGGLVVIDAGKCRRSNTSFNLA